MAGASDQAVSDYLDHLFFDVHLPPVSDQFEFQPCDSVDMNCRLQSCFDPFSFMSLTDTSQLVIWEAFLQLLVIARSLPQGKLKQYVFKQCQILYHKIAIRGDT